MEVKLLPVHGPLVPGYRVFQGESITLACIRFENTCYHHVKPNVPGLFATVRHFLDIKLPAASDLIIMKKPSMFTTYLALAPRGTY